MLFKLNACHICSLEPWLVDGGPGLLLASACASFCRWCEASKSPGVSKDCWIFFCFHFLPHLPRGINIILPNLLQTRSSFPYWEQFSQPLTLYQIWRCSLTALSLWPSLSSIFWGGIFFFFFCRQKALNCYFATWRSDFLVGGLLPYRVSILLIIFPQLPSESFLLFCLGGFFSFTSALTGGWCIIIIFFMRNWVHEVQMLVDWLTTSLSDQLGRVVLNIFKMSVLKKWKLLTLFFLSLWSPK